jgi:hypothetical protein
MWGGGASLKNKISCPVNMRQDLSNHVHIDFMYLYYFWSNTIKTTVYASKENMKSEVFTLKMESAFSR